MRLAISKRLTILWMIAAVAGCLVFTSLPAQYVYDPNAADEQAPGVRYFGAVKDNNGLLIPGAMISLTTGQYSFVFITDEQGRFRGLLSLEIPTNTVQATCSKPGFQLVRVTKRLGPKGVKPTVQVDCILRPAA